MRRLLLLSVVGLLGCGESTGDDAGAGDAGLDAGTPFDAGTDAGAREDAGTQPVDAGPPPRSVFGSMQVNGVEWQLWTGYSARSATTRQFRLITGDALSPRIQVTLIVPLDVSSGYAAECGANVFFGAQYVTDAGIGFYTVHPTCDAGITTAAAMAGDDFEGTFNATVELDDRSLVDAGGPAMVITNGTFRLQRTD